MKRTIRLDELRKQESRVLGAVVFGFGPIGMMACEQVLKRPSLRLDGVVDVRPDIIGKTVGEVLGGGCASGVVIRDKLERAKPGAVAVHTTSSHLPGICDQIESLLDAGYDVVSSSEELSEPWLRRPDLAARIDAKARAADRTVVGTGINPGWVLDLLPALLSLPCVSVKSVKAERILDAGRRRGPLQKKIGSGMTPDEFEQLAQRGMIGHVGLVESAAFIAEAFGWRIDRIEENLGPAVAEAEITTEHVRVLPGQVRGIDHKALAFEGDDLRADLRLVMALGEPRQYDRLTLDSDPAVDVVVNGGYFGDTATAGILVNLIPSVAEAPAGLLSAWELARLGCKPDAPGRKFRFAE
ncbi:MAG TPA: dihydrodipicolinate reductase [Candidatus Brocadiia bacterium]|nr:dihydrodipicolinate reductase [Candidatus Brocadiia bacterium]